MTAPDGAGTADPRSVIGALRGERDAALARNAALTEALAARGTRHADGRALGQRVRGTTGAPGRDHRCAEGDVGLAQRVHLRSITQAYGDAEMEAYRQLWPMPPTRGSMVCRAILDRQTIHTPDITADQEVLQR